MDIEFSGPGWYVFSYDIYKRREHYTLSVWYGGSDWVNSFAQHYQERMIYIYDDFSFWTELISQIKKLALLEGVSE